MFEKSLQKPKKKQPPKLPDAGRFDDMLNRAKTSPADLEDLEEKSPRSKGKRGTERLQNKDLIKSGADAARNTIRSKSLPDKKESLPKPEQVKDTRSLSMGMDPLPDELPGDDVQDHVKEAFKAVLEHPAPLNKAALVNLMPRYRALCEKYGVRPNSGVMQELEHVLAQHTFFYGKKEPKVVYNFSHCLLGDRGVAPVLLALCYDRQRPIRVNLRDCGLHTNGCYVVAGFLRHPSLVQLDMSDNPVSLTAGEFLLAAIEDRSEDCPSVDLRLERTYVSKTGEKPVVGYPCGHRRNLRPRYSMVAKSLGRARSPSPDGSEKSFDKAESEISKTSVNSNLSAYNHLRNQFFRMATEDEAVHHMKEETVFLSRRHVG
jgi:hypothetical protein